MHYVSSLMSLKALGEVQCVYHVLGPEGTGQGRCVTCMGVYVWYCQLLCVWRAPPSTHFLTYVHLLAVAMCARGKVLYFFYFYLGQFRRFCIHFCIVSLRAALRGCYGNVALLEFVFLIWGNFAAFVYLGVTYPCARREGVTTAKTKSVFIPFIFP